MLLRGQVFSVYFRLLIWGMSVDMYLHQIMEQTGIHARKLMPGQVQGLQGKIGVLR